MQEYLQPTFYFDYESPEIQQLISNFQHLSELERITQLYIHVRDHWRYNPYTIGLTENHFKASTIYNKKQAHCIDKSILYIAGLRALGIPARLRLAKVSNHIAVERLEQKLGSNELAPHGLVDVYSDGNWVKCSPVFNKELCDMYNVATLDFDGKTNAVLQEYNRDQVKFMEYLEDYGNFADVPLDFIKETFKNHYPALYQQFKDSEEANIF
ncbi:transglutaminase [Kordia sp. TARA_039_SRF]|nr:transglutaminase [Kordia sp. TARA_039_SRF]